MTSLIPSARAASKAALRPLSRTLASAATTIQSSSTASSSSSSPSDASTSSSSSTLPTLTPWTPFTTRTPLLVKKRGMTALYSSTTGQRTPVTILQLQSNLQVISHIPPPVQSEYSKHDPFSSTKKKHTLILAGGDVKEGNMTKQMKGVFKAKGLECKKLVRGFEVSEDAVLEVGSTLSAAHFVPGQYVDVIGTSIGKGFAGVMKRHGFHGLKASHGVSVTHRSAGSTGQHQDPGRVLPGKKMAGHMGVSQRTTQNLLVLKIDNVLNIIYVKGCVPGTDDSDLVVRDSKKKVTFKGMGSLKKGKGSEEWLGGGVLGLPVPGVVKGMEVEKGLGVVEIS